MFCVHCIGNNDMDTDTNYCRLLYHFKLGFKPHYHFLWFFCSISDRMQLKKFSINDEDDASNFYVIFFFIQNKCRICWPKIESLKKLNFWLTTSVFFSLTFNSIFLLIRKQTLCSCQSILCSFWFRIYRIRFPNILNGIQLKIIKQ